jgi:alkylation response protein AidB-like acyl-CoA dehydrogenase
VTLREIIKTFAQGLPAQDWVVLIADARNLADDAGFNRFAYRVKYGGAGNPRQTLLMCAIRHHLARNYFRALSLANDLQSEHRVVENKQIVIMLHYYGTSAQLDRLIPAAICGDFRATFDLAERTHGSDANYLDTSASLVTLSDGSQGYEINGYKTWLTGAHHVTHNILFARTSVQPGSAYGITAFIVPHNTPGVIIESLDRTVNMPAYHNTISLY